MMRKIKEADPIVIDFLKNIFVANQDEEEGVFETDEEKEDPKVFIPKLFCQVGDKKSGWHSKTVQAFAVLLLTILSGGQGGKFSMADKGKPPPPWFVGSWQTYTNPTFASLEANTDLILGIFQFHNLDPRVHNLQPLYDHAEEGELPEEADGGEPGGQELGELNEENLEDIPLVFEVPVNTDEDVLAMTQNDDNTNQEREESDSLNLVLEYDTEAEEDEQNPRILGDKEGTRSNMNIPNPAIPQPNIPENGKKRFNLFTMVPTMVPTWSQPWCQP